MTTVGVELIRSSLIVFAEHCEDGGGVERPDLQTLLCQEALQFAFLTDLEPRRLEKGGPGGDRLAELPLRVERRQKTFGVKDRLREDWRVDQDDADAVFRHELRDDRHHLPLLGSAESAEIVGIDADLDGALVPKTGSAGSAAESGVAGPEQ